MRTNRQLRRRAVGILAAVVGAGVLTILPAAAADPPVVVGIGDSYASGEGAGTYDSGTNTPVFNMCHRSPLSWQRMATIPDVAGEPRRIHVACSGATTTNVLQGGQYLGEPPQILSVAATDPSVVLVSIGGNDIGFRNMVIQCWTLPDCTTTSLMRGTEGRIALAATEVRRVLDGIAQLAPQATIVLAGYPQLIQGACNNFSTAEAARFDQLSQAVRTAWVGEVMAMRLAGRNARFADTIDPFEGHGACSPTPWINPVALAPGDGQMVVESMHPNPNGYLAYANATSTVLRTDPMRCDADGCRIKFREESVYHSRDHGTHTVRGAIRIAYQSEGEERGFLGYPTSEEYAEPAEGRGQQFTGGTYWWRRDVGAFPVKGKILAKYTAIGDVAEIGTPTSKEIDVAGGRVQNFSSGQMFFKFGTTAAFFSKGIILGKYRTERTTTGPLGWPTTDHACGLQPGNACRQHFDGTGGSVIYWTSATGAHKVTGPYRDFYASTGWQNSTPDPGSTRIAGYPTTDVHPGPGMGLPTQDFQFGSIVHDVPKKAMCWVVGGRAYTCRPATT